MGETRSHADNASASSDDSIKPPPRLDSANIKPGPGALAPDDFDPLVHNELEAFWHAVDQYFHPINQDHVRHLRAIPVNPYNGVNDRDLRLPPPRDSDATKSPDPRDKRKDSKRDIKREKTLDDSKRPSDRSLPSKVKNETSLVTMRSPASVNSDAGAFNTADPDPNAPPSSLNSFPFQHRLIAAFVDENPDKTPAPSFPPNRSKGPQPIEDCIWIGMGSEPEVRQYQSVFELRCRVILLEADAIEVRQDDPIQNALRQHQWKLRDLKTANRIRKEHLYTSVMRTQLFAQARQREVKKHQDIVERAYLERMVSNLKKNKKSRSKYQRILQRMFGHYKDKEKNAEKSKKAAEVLSNGRLLAKSEDKVRASGKKKKKKGEHPGPSAVPSINGGQS